MARGNVGIRDALSIKQSWVPRSFPRTDARPRVSLPFTQPAERRTVLYQQEGGGSQQASNQTNRTGRPSTQQHPEADISLSSPSLVSIYLPRSAFPPTHAKNQPALY